MRDAPDERQRHVRGLGDERDVVLFQPVEDDERIKAGAVVADEHKAPRIGQLVQPCDVRAHPAVAEEKPGHAHACRAAQRVLLDDWLGVAHKERHYRHKKNVHQIERDEDRREHQNAFPHDRTGGFHIYNGDDDRCREKRKDKHECIALRE